MTTRLFVVAAAIGLGACSLSKQNTPTLSGPSEFGLSLDVSATPDTVQQDGMATSTILVVARDASSQPAKARTLRLDILVDGVLTDFGVLSSNTISTDSDGLATATYLVPPPPPPQASFDHIVTILVTPVGSNYDNATTRSVSIRVTPPTVIVPTNGIVADFRFTPAKPKVDDNVSFDGSLSYDTGGKIVKYQWTFGDGYAKEGVLTNHDYTAAGDYIVTLTVTDDRGLTASKSRILTVSGAEYP